MKKLSNIRLFIGIVLLLFITSCAKDWKCECTSSDPRDWGFDVPNAKRSLAKQRCDEYESQVKAFTGDEDASCKLK